MEAAKLQTISKSLFSLSEEAWLDQSKWSQIKAAIVDLAKNVSSYIDQLDQQRAGVNTNHSLMTPVRSSSEAESFIVIRPQATEPLERYQELNDLLKSANDFEPVFVNDVCPASARQRRYYMDCLPQSIQVHAVKFSHSYGNNLGTMHFMWSIPDSITESELLHQNMIVAQSVREKIQIYHTRAMRREAMNTFGRLCGVKPQFLREIYKRLTGDMSASRTANEAEIDTRVRLALDGEDANIIVDLREMNEGRQEKFSVFWSECKAYLENVTEVSVQERRHGEITYLASALSSRDMLEEVAKRCPEGTPVPSEAWLRYQFWPTDPSKRSASQYTGRLKVKYMVQASKFHPDSHYASALYRYLRCFAIKHASVASFFSLDDKHHCKVGEPGHPVAAVERGKRVIVALDKKFIVSDHDFTRFSLIPTVALQVDIPTSINNTFHRGQVHIGLKDLALEPSSALRHSTELSKVCAAVNYCVHVYMKLIKVTSVHDYTITLIVPLSLSLSLSHPLRTPPYHSWKNPVERIMSIVNIALQGVGLMRSPMSEKQEEEISSCNSVKSIREVCDSNGELQAALADSMQSTKCLLETLLSRLKLKGNPFQNFHAASTVEIDAQWNHLLKIEPLLTKGDTNASIIPLRPGLKRFLNHCCVDRRYFFSIKKCGSTTCSICCPPRLPVDIFDTLHHLPDPVPDSTGEHYKDFDDIYGSDTSEKHCPSLADSSRKPHGIPFQRSAQYAKNVNETIKCTECLKPRVLYSKNKLRFTYQITLQNLLVAVNYSCGSVLSDFQDETLSRSQREVVDKVFVRANLQCEDKIETPYYSSNSFIDVCIHCGDPDNIVQEERDILPTCKFCLDNKPKVFRRKRSQMQPTANKQRRLAQCSDT